MSTAVVGGGLRVQFRGMSDGANSWDLGEGARSMYGYTRTLCPCPQYILYNVSNMRALQAPSAGGVCEPHRTVYPSCGFYARLSHAVSPVTKTIRARKRCILESNMYLLYQEGVVEATRPRRGIAFFPAMIASFSIARWRSGPLRLLSD